MDFSLETIGAKSGFSLKLFNRFRPLACISVLAGIYNSLKGKGKIKLFSVSHTPCQKAILEHPFIRV